MPNVNNLYPSNYLKAADLAGKVARVAIAHVTMEKIGNDQKPVLYFRGKEKGLVLNKTNGMAIASSYGPETDNWTGGEVELFSAYVDFQGKQTEAIRVRIPAQRPAASRAPAGSTADDPRTQPAAPAPMRDTPPFDDEIPF